MLVFVPQMTYDLFTYDRNSSQTCAGVWRDRQEEKVTWSLKTMIGKKNHSYALHLLFYIMLFFLDVRNSCICISFVNEAARLSYLTISDTMMDLSIEPRDRARERERDRGRSHERKHHSSSATERKQRYYSCDRYGNREPCHSRSPGPSRSTSPGDPQEPNRFKTVLTKQITYFVTVIFLLENVL